MLETKNVIFNIRKMNVQYFEKFNYEYLETENLDFDLLVLKSRTKLTPTESCLSSNILSRMSVRGNIRWCKYFIELDLTDELNCGQSYLIIPALLFIFSPLVAHCLDLKYIKRAVWRLSFCVFRVKFS